MTLDTTDRRIIAATQAGLPLVAEPYAEVAGWLGLTEAEVLARLDAMRRAGLVRRVALAPNHCALGMQANAMSVWDVADDRAEDMGARVGALGFVSQCCLRSRALPQWPYNLFAMLHGPDRATVEAHHAEVVALLGRACHRHDILHSTRILKKAGMRLRPQG